jgi:hypothetical protein
MDHQDRQPIWRAVRAQCATIGQYAHLHAEELPTAEGLREVLVALLTTVEQILTQDLSCDEDAEDRASEICAALITRVFNVWVRQS